MTTPNERPGAIDLRTYEREPRPGERCDCGRPAVIVYITAAHGDVPYCGIPVGAPHTDDDE